ncbi:hypothetical protein D3C72_2251340 [compost metagenome]
MISAQRKNGNTIAVEVKSQYGGTLKLKLDMPNPIFKIKGKGKYTKQEDGLIRLELNKGAIVTIRESK